MTKDKQANILIRKTEPSDVVGIQQIYTGKNAYSNTLQLPDPSLDMWTKRLANISDNVYSYVAVHDAEGENAYYMARIKTQGN